MSGKSANRSNAPAAPRIKLLAEQIEASSPRPKGSQYIQIDGYVMRSAAWLSLDCKARCAYQEFKLLYREHRPEIAMSGARMASLLNLADHRGGSVAIGQLVDRGIIKRTRVAAFNVAGQKGLAATYVLTENKVGIAPPTKDFMRWAPPVAKQKRQPRKAAGPVFEVSILDEARQSVAADFQARRDAERQAAIAAFDEASLDDAEHSFNA